MSDHPPSYSDATEPPAPYAPTPYPEKGAPPPAGDYMPPVGQPYPQQGQPYPPQQGMPPPQAGYGQPAQPGYGPPPPQQGQQQQHTVVVTQPMVQTTVIQQFRESPVQTVCPHCRAQIVTGTHHETGTFTWLLCAVICIVGCDLGCCFIPFCIDGCKDVIHSCPNCRQQVSRWSRL